MPIFNVVVIWRDCQDVKTPNKEVAMSPCPAFLPSSPLASLRHGFATQPICRCRPRASPQQPRMSGVNGGIDYEIDLSTLPPALASRISYIQSGPDSPTELIAAAREIASAAPANPQTLPVLVDMLGFNNPVAAAIAVDALSAAGAPAVPSLLRGVAAFNYSVNAYALRALGRVGDPAVLDVALACAVRGPIPNVRRAAVRALAGLRYETEEQARRAYEQLLALADAEPDWGVRYASLAALQVFVKDELVGAQMLTKALEVVGAAADGRSRVYVKDEDGDEKPPLPAEPTVSARAFVAFEVLSERIGALVGV